MSATLSLAGSLAWSRLIGWLKGQSDVAGAVNVVLQDTPAQLLTARSTLTGQQGAMCGSVLCNKLSDERPPWICACVPELRNQLDFLAEWKCSGRSMARKKKNCSDYRQLFLTARGACGFVEYRVGLSLAEQLKNVKEATVSSRRWKWQV